MTFNKLCSLVAKKEGKKKQVSIGNVREVLSVLVHLEACHRTKVNVSAGPMDCLWKMSVKASNKMIEAKAKKAKRKSVKGKIK